MKDYFYWKLIIYIEEIMNDKKRDYPRYMCPKCKDNPSLVVYDYAKRKPVCGNCGTPFSEFIEDLRPTISRAL
jgi:ribosomal protein S27E